MNSSNIKSLYFTSFLPSTYQKHQKRTTLASNNINEALQSHFYSHIPEAALVITCAWL